MGDFLKTYLAFTSHQESPEPFHFWMGLALIACALGRRVFLNIPAPEGFSGTYTLFPNLYLCLVAPSGRCRKGGAIKMGLKILEEVPEMVVLREKLTMAYISMRLAKDGSLIIIAPEMRTFVDADAMRSGLAVLLTTIYDCPSKIDYLTKTAGQFRAVNVCPNIIAASTPEWLPTVSETGEIAGGYAARWVFVVQLETERYAPFPYEDLELKLELIKQLTEISMLEGAFEVNRGARTLFESWYGARRKEQKDARLASYYERKHDLVWKLAMCSRVSRDREKLVIEKRDVKDALEWLRMMEQWMPLAYRRISSGEYGRMVDRILALLTRAGGKMSQKELLRQVMYWGMTERDLREALGALAHAGFVNRTGVGSLHWELTAPVEEGEEEL